MIEQPLQQYIWLGTCIRYLIDAQEGNPLHVPHADGDVIYNLRRLRETLDEYGFKVSATHFDMFGLAELVEGFEDRSAADPEAEYYLTGRDAKKLHDMVTVLRQTIDSEAHHSIAYVVHSRRHSVDTLLKSPEVLFADGAFSSIPPIAKYDIGEGCKAIVFELPTAAAFHLLRATEACLRQYYECVIRRDRISNRMWGPMITHLRQRKSKAPPGALLDHLDSIRRNFRNPTQHPEAIYDLEEAQDLLALCADAITRMYRDSDGR